MLDERVWRAHPEGDIEKNVPGGRLTPSTACPLDDAANLFVARPEKSQLRGDQAETAVGLGNRDGCPVQPLSGGNEP